MRRLLSKLPVHSARGLGDVECWLLLLLLLGEAGLLRELLLLGEAGLLRGERVREARGDRLERLARRVGEGGAGLLALVQCLLVPGLLLRDAELRLPELRLWLEACLLRLHGRVAGGLRHHAVLLLRIAGIAGWLRLLEALHLLEALSVLQVLHALALRGELGLRVAGLHRLLVACELGLEGGRAEAGVLLVEAWS